MEIIASFALKKERVNRIHRWTIREMCRQANIVCVAFFGKCDILAIIHTDVSITPIYYAWHNGEFHTQKQN